MKASPELFGTFDYVLCLSRSELIYFGPVNEALNYMCALGYGLISALYSFADFWNSNRYRKPTFRNLPDFLADICSDPSEHYFGASPTQDLILSAPYWNKNRNSFFSIASSPTNLSYIEGRGRSNSQRIAVIHYRARRYFLCTSRSLSRVCSVWRSWSCYLEGAYWTRVSTCWYFFCPNLYRYLLYSRN